MSKAKNINFQRVCLFIVEGVSDKIALTNILTKHFSGKQIRTCVLRSDITSSKNCLPENIVEKISDKILDWLKSSKLKKADLFKVIQITDLDGTFIEDKLVKYDSSHLDPFYTNECIKTKFPTEIKERNHNKAANILKLIKYDKIMDVEYKLVYMSCNLDHVLYNQNNLSKEEKQTYAENFAERFLGKELDFFTFLKNEKIIDDKNYEDSWLDIQKKNHSLLRKTNIDKVIKNSK